MNAIKATWSQGQIVPSQPVDWPEDTELIVEPVLAGEKIGLTEAEWRDDPESIEEWVKWLESLEPMILTDEERIEMEKYREASRLFNLEAVRRQMAEMGSIHA